MVTNLHFVMHLCRHASTDAAKGHVRNDIDDMRQHVVTFAFRETGHARQDARKDKEAIAASNQAHVILVQSQAIGLSNDIGRARHGWTWKQTGLEAHAQRRTRLFAELSRLETQTSAKLSLTTLVVGPTRARFDVVQSSMAHVHLDGAKAQQRSQDAARFAARCLAERNVKLGVVVNVGSVGASILALGHFIRSQWLRGEATKDHDWWLVD